LELAQLLSQLWGEVMTPELALSWVVLGSVTLCVVLGTSVVGAVTYTHLRTLRIAALSLAFAIVGALLMTTPKWTELVVKWGDFEAKLAKVETQLGMVTAERDRLDSVARDATIKIAALTAERDRAREAVQTAAFSVNEIQTAPWKVDGAKLQLDALIKQWQLPN
jgi:hypothetical protein